MNACGHNSGGVHVIGLVLLLFFFFCFVFMINIAHSSARNSQIVDKPVHWPSKHFEHLLHMMATLPFDNTMDCTWTAIKSGIDFSAIKDIWYSKTYLDELGTTSVEAEVECFCKIGCCYCRMTWCAEIMERSKFIKNFWMYRQHFWCRVMLIGNSFDLVEQLWP